MEAVYCITEKYLVGIRFISQAITEIGRALCSYAETAI